MPSNTYTPTIIEQVIDFVKANGPQRRCDIARFIVEMIYHKLWTPENSRKYSSFSASFANSHGYGYFCRTTRKRHECLKQLPYSNKKGLYGVYSDRYGWVGHGEGR